MISLPGQRDSVSDAVSDPDLDSVSDSESESVSVSRRRTHARQR